MENGTTEPVVPLLTEEGDRLELLDEAPLLGGESRVFATRDAAGRRLALKLSLLPLPAGRWIDVEVEVLRELAADPRVAALVAGVRGRGSWGGRPFFTMDWHPDTLATFVARETSIPRRLAVAVAVAGAVAAVHEARPGLVHRDLKPSNILLAADGTVRIADFGAARPCVPGSTTTTNAVFTEGFAPPEQRLPLPQSPRQDQDVYALGATVFFALIGHAPRAVAANGCAWTPVGRALFAGGTGAPPIDDCLAWGRMTALTAADRADLRRVVRGPLLAVLTRTLEPRPAHRVATARDLAVALAATRPRARRWWPAGCVVGVTALVAFLWPRPAPPRYDAFLVPGGSAILGEDPPLQAVEATRTVVIAPFRLGAAEVDQALWREVMGVDTSSYRVFEERSLDQACTTYAGLEFVGDTLPAVCVDFASVARFANALSGRQGLQEAYSVVEVEDDAAPRVTWNRAANGWRLPTSDEWEYAARAGRDARWDVDDPMDLCRVQNGGDRALGMSGWPTALACDDGHAGLAPVDAFPANAWGLRSMSGNAIEWVWDPREDGRRTTRGVGFYGRAEELRFAYTGGEPPETAKLTLGFRLARAP